MSELDEIEGGEDEEDFGEDMFGDEDLDLHNRYYVCLCVCVRCGMLQDVYTHCTVVMFVPVEPQSVEIKGQVFITITHCISSDIARSVVSC